MLKQAEAVSHGRGGDKDEPPSTGDAETTKGEQARQAPPPPTLAGLLLGMLGNPAVSPEVRKQAEDILRHLQAEARAERARRAPHRGDFGYGSSKYELGTDTHHNHKRSHTPPPPERDGPTPLAAAAAASQSDGGRSSMGGISAVEAAAIGRAVPSASTGSGGSGSVVGAAGPVGSPAPVPQQQQGRSGAELLIDVVDGGTTRRIEALHELGRLALQEQQRWALLRCQGLVATLVTLAGGHASADAAPTGPTSSSTTTTATAAAAAGNVANAESQRLAAKALAHLGTTDAIKEKLLSHRGLAELVRQPPLGLDESAVVYLQMLAPLKRR